MIEFVFDNGLHEKFFRLFFCLLSLIFISCYGYWIVFIRKVEVFNYFNKGFSKRKGFNWSEFLAFSKSCASTVSSLTSVSIGFTLMTIILTYEREFKTFDYYIITAILTSMVIASLSFAHSLNLFHDVDSRTHFGDKNIESYFYRACLLWTVGLYLLFFALIISLVIVSTIATVVGNIGCCILLVYYLNSRL